MSNIAHQDRVDVIETINLPTDNAIQWLKEHAYSEPPNWISGSDYEKHKLVSFAFARRNSSRLRLAVARYGSHAQTLKRLFENGSTTERLAALSNSAIGPTREGGLIRPESNILSASDALEILRNYGSRTREFAVFVSNSSLDRDWLADIIEGWDKIDGLDTEGLLLLIHFLSGNPVIGSKRDDTFMDGWAEYSYKRLNFALANLLQKAPVDLNWAQVLCRMLQRLHLPYTPDFEVDLLDRWKDPEPTEEGERWSFPNLREQITSCLIVRNHRADSKSGITVDHEDAAVRKGLYSSLSPYELFRGISRGRDFYYPSFEYLEGSDLTESQQAVVDFCKKCFERDKNDFIEGLIRNIHFWKTKDERAFLSDISWHLAEDPHSLMDVPNSYRATKQYYVENYPSFFEDDDLVDVPYEDSVEGKISQLQSELKKLRDEIESQSLEDLAEQQRSHFELFIEQTQNQIRRLSDDLSNKTDELAKTIAEGSLSQQFHLLEIRIRRQGMLIWVLIFAIGMYLYLSLN